MIFKGLSLIFGRRPQIFKVLFFLEDHNAIINELGKDNMLDFSLNRKKIGEGIFVSPLPYGENSISGVSPKFIHDEIYNVVTKAIKLSSDNKIDSSNIIDELKNYIENRKQKGSLQRFSVFFPSKCGQYKIDAANKIIKLMDPLNAVRSSGMDLNELSACLEEGSTLCNIIAKTPSIKELCSEEKRKAEIARIISMKEAKLTTAIDHNASMRKAKLTTAAKSKETRTRLIKSPQRKNNPIRKSSKIPSTQAFLVKKHRSSKDQARRDPNKVTRPGLGKSSVLFAFKSLLVLEGLLLLYLFS